MAKAVDTELAQGAINVANHARSLAPQGKTGKLKASIFADTSQPFNKTVGSNLWYAPFVEFGTGVNVFKTNFRFTPEMRDYAKEFFVTGKGFAYPVPYLFPAVEAERKEIVKRIRNKVFELNKV